MAQDLIIGIHSIVEAINNPNRSNKYLYATDDGIKNLKIKIPTDVTIEKLNSNDFQNKAKRLIEKKGHSYSRITSQALLAAEPLEIKNFSWLINEKLKQEELKLFCIDSVTDVHNAAAILRTCAFYGVDAFIMSMKGNFGLSPSFFRNASGATEHVPIVQVSALPKAITKLEEFGVSCIGFSEHENLQVEDIKAMKKSCIIVGAEDIGLSNAVMRVLKHVVAIKGAGKIKSLNVSVAAAIAMEKIY